MSQAARRGNGPASATGKNGRKLGFPMMSPHEVYSCLGLLGINCATEDLTKPTPASTRAIWAGLLEILCGVSQNQFENPRNAVLGGMEYKELYSDGLGFLMFFHHCRDLADRCGVPLNITDLTRPDAMHLRTALSGVLNFAKFREENSGLADKLQAQLESNKEREIALQKKIDKLDAAIGDLKAMQDEDRPRVESAKKRNEEVRNELRGLSEEQRQLSGEYERMKQERHALSKEGKERALLLENLEAKINEAKSRLVRSPDRIRRTISEMSHQVASQKEDLNRTTEKLHEHTKRLEVLQGLETELKRLIALGREIESQQTTTEELRRGKEKLQAAVDQAKTEGLRLQERNEHLEKQISFADEKLTRQRERFEKIHTDSQARIAELTAAYNQKDKERAVMEGQLVELENEQKQLHAEMKEYIAKNQAEIRKVLETYWTLRQRADDYMEQISGSLGFSDRIQV